MALPVNIDDLVNHRKVEWARIEYKEGWNPEKVLHSLCAFANDIDNWGGGLVEGRNTGVPIIVNVMRRNGSPMPVFSSPENRDWLSVTLPINPHFCEMKSPISQTTALKTALKYSETAQITALKTALKTGEIAPERPKVAPEIALEIAPEKSAGGASSRTISKENRAVLQDNGHVVSVITAEEELAQIEIALKIALEIAPKRFRVQKSKKIRERMAQIIQCLLRNRRTSIADLVAAMNVSLRTLRADISLLRKIKVLKRIGADKNGSWDVLLDYGRNR
jgi:predicted HTH transcriptional regulator